MSIFVETATYAAPVRARLKPMSSNAAREAEAIAAFDRGDYNAVITVLVRAYGQALYRYCFRMLNEDQALAEDVHVETFAQASLSLSRFERRSTFYTWLMKIARYRCLDALREEEARRRGMETLGQRTVNLAPDADGGYSIRQAIKYCLNRLDNRTRELVLLRMEEGLSYDEIATIRRPDWRFSEKHSTLAKQVERALEDLRKCLEAQNAAPQGEGT